jgi:hypothetical protein
MGFAPFFESNQMISPIWLALRYRLLCESIRFGDGRSEITGRA